MTQTQCIRIRHARAVLFFMALALMAVPVSAQGKAEPHVWTAVSVRGRTNSETPWQWTASSLVGTRNGARTMDFVLGSVLVSRTLGSDTAVGGGYTFGAAFPNSAPVHEHRFVQQVALKAGVAWRVSFKSQLQERLISGHHALVIETSQHIRVVSPATPRGVLHGVVSAEVLIRANSSAGAARGFESDVMFVGAGKQVTNRQWVEVGYANFRLSSASGGTRTTHVLSATVIAAM